MWQVRTSRPTAAWKPLVQLTKATRALDPCCCHHSTPPTPVSGTGAGNQMRESDERGVHTETEMPLRGCSRDKAVGCLAWGFRL